MADAASTLICDIAGFEFDPLGFVKYAFPWGKGELAGHTGPRRWQAEFLTEIGEKLRAGGDRGCVIQEAIASGHGIGKSAEVAWLIYWALSTFEDTRGVVTANTEAQLRTKTWAELAKWHRLAINAHWFKLTATAIFSADPKHEKTWRIDAIAQNESNPEAFAGLHNQGRRLLIVFDEASGIPRIIWEVISGALSDEGTQIIFAVFGNATQPEGAFRDCFGRYAHRWTTRQIDSRTVEGLNKEQIQKDIEDHGEDSDFVRIRWRGIFPRAGTNQFISSEIVAAAADARRKAVFNAADPVVVGVDVARFGQDESVICTRKGRDARSIPMQHFRGLDTMQLAARVVAHLEWLDSVGAGWDAVFVDEGGIGGAVIDRLRMLGYRAIGVNNGSPSDETPGGIMVKNKAAEQWVRMRDWLGSAESGGALPVNDHVLCSQLEGREFWYNDQQRVVLETKDEMAARGIGSPDRADALALTFAQNIGSHEQRRRVDDVPDRPRFDPLARVRR